MCDSDAKAGLRQPEHGHGHALIGQRPERVRVAPRRRRAGEKAVVRVMLVSGLVCRLWIAAHTRGSVRE